MCGSLWMNGGHGFGFFSFPLLFLLGAALIFYFWRNGFSFSSHPSVQQTSIDSSDEVGKLRREIEELRRELKH